MRQSENNYMDLQKDDSNIIQKTVAKYLPYWPLFLLFSILALAGAYIYLRYATPMYEARATIIIKDEKRGSEDSKLMESLNLIASKKVVENEIEVLQSRALMQDVVKKLYLYAPISLKGKVKESDAYVFSPVLVEVQNPDSIFSDIEKINFSYDKNSQTVTLNGKDKIALNQFVATPYGTLRFLHNNYYQPTLESDKQLSFSLYDPQKISNNLIKQLKVFPASQSAILDLIYQDEVPRRAVNILNTLLAIYDQKSIDDKNANAKSTLTFVNQQLAILGGSLDSIEKKVQQYKSGKNAVNISDQGGLFLQNAAANDQKLGEVNSQMAVLDQVETYISSKSGQSGVLPSSLGIGDPTLSVLTNRLYNAEMEYEKLKKTVGENNPKLVALADEINKMRPSILDNIRNQKTSLKATQQSLYSTNSGINSMLSRVPEKERQLLEINREQMSKYDQYQTLLKTKQQAELSLASVVSGSRVIDSALAGDRPVSPKKKMIYIMAIMAAFAITVGIILMRDVFTGKIKYRSEIEGMTVIPIIGEIAFEKFTSPLVIEKGARSFVAEEFRKLRISLSFLGIDSTHKKLLITSSISGEGKSFISANLAVSISLTGKKVVLVDMDLNNPTISKILNIDYEDGVSEFLNDEKTVEEIIYKVNSHDNLHFIPAGSLPENPTELLANGKIKSLIEYLDSNFDMVLIDTSPAVLVTDAYILSEMCDATLYVVRHNYTPKLLIRRIDENNQINPIHNPAIVFNGVKTRGVFKNNYGYGYDYVYGNKDRGKSKKKYNNI